MSKEAREQALKFINVRMRCEREIREQLRRKGHSSADITDAVDYLYRFGYLDDFKYCEAFIHDRLKFNPCGRLKLLYDLQQKGVERRRSGRRSGGVGHCAAHLFRQASQLRAGHSGRMVRPSRSA